MNPYQMAQEQCAGWMRGTGCVTPPGSGVEGVCVLDGDGGRCSYFEACVLPLCLRPDLYRAPRMDAKGKPNPGDHPDPCRIRYAGMVEGYRQLAGGGAGAKSPARPFAAP